jgi:hypothetical protein
VLLDFRTVSLKLQGDIVKSIKMQGLCLYLRAAGSLEEGVATYVPRAEGSVDGNGLGRRIPEVAGVNMLLQHLDGIARLSLDTGKRYLVMKGS